MKVNLFLGYGDTFEDSPVLTGEGSKLDLIYQVKDFECDSIPNIEAFRIEVIEYLESGTANELDGNAYFLNVKWSSKDYIGVIVEIVSEDIDIYGDLRHE